jgi:outer membrane murein-binding lipoprotein Lpp
MKTTLIFAAVLTAVVAASGAASAQKTEEVGQNP